MPKKGFLKWNPKNNIKMTFSGRIYRVSQAADLGFFFTTICFMTVHEKLQNLTTLSLTVQKISQKNPRLSTLKS